MKFLFFLLTILPVAQLISQVENTGLMDTIGGVKINKLSVGGYVDAYYGGLTAGSPNNKVPYFVSMNRNNELTINLAFIDIKYTDHNFRARFTPGFGTYMNANYASEPGTLKNIIEATVGCRIFKNKDIWLDAGVMGSPYTNESAISKDHLMYTRSFAPEYVPYYLSGIKISSPLSKKLNGYLYIINGWQQIQDNNRSKSIGTQLEYRPNNLHLINWNTYIGNEKSDFSVSNRMRYFTDVYWIYNPEGKFSATSCVYVGNQIILTANDKNSSNYWWQANFIGRYSFNSKYALSGRIEYFSDPHNIQISPVNGSNSFSAFSGGLCFNIKLQKNALIRFEGRQFYSEHKIFSNANNIFSHNMTWLISNMTVWF